MSGAGNDFILMDNRTAQVTLTEAQIYRLCRRRTGIGADGLILLEAAEGFDFAMRYYNADGRLGSMCGNGGRCITRFAHDCGISGTQFEFEANGKRYRSEILDDGRIRLQMQPPHSFREAFQVEGVESFYVDTGSPHAVVYVNEIEALDVDGVGKSIRRSAKAFPDGANVNFAEVRSADTIRLRTFERGVEAETLACGTGAVATAVVSYKHGFVNSERVKLLVQSGETLEVAFTPDFTEVFLIGSAAIVFSGSVEV